MEKSNYGQSSNTSFKASTATSQYDAWGRLIAVREHTPKQSDIDDTVRYMSLDGDGMILRRREGSYTNNAFSQTTAEKGRDAVFTYGAGQQLAEQTRDGAKLDVFGLAGLRDAGKASKDQQKFIDKQARNGNRMGAYDQFTQRFSVYGQDGASRVQVQSGDTLQGIAQRVYGNSSLWYVLAAANALSGDSGLIAGTQLKVPEVGVSKNDAGTFKPYNPNEIVGSTSPSLPFIPPASSNQCAMMAMVVVMAVATVFTAGAATAGFSAGLQAIMTTGLSLVTGGFGVGAMAIYGGLGAFAGSIASQAVGKALGVVDKISLRQAVGSGLTAVFTAGIAGKLGFVSDLINSSSWGRVAASAALGSMASYAGNEIAGVKNNSFSWKALAASAVTAVVAGKITSKLGEKLNLDYATESGQFTSEFIGNMAGGVVGLHTRRAFGFDDKVDYGMIAADAFGNLIGNSITGKHKYDAAKYAQMRAQAATDAMMPTKEEMAWGACESQPRADCRRVKFSV